MHDTPTIATTAYTHYCMRKHYYFNVFLSNLGGRGISGDKASSGPFLCIVHTPGTPSYNYISLCIDDFLQKFVSYFFHFFDYKFFEFSFPSRF